MLTTSRSILHRWRPRSSTGWIGIDIGSHSVKLVQLELVNGRKQIAESLILPVPSSGLFNADSLDGGWLATTLRAELARGHRFRGRTAACVFSMYATEMRSLEIPAGSLKERREMISLELVDPGSNGGASREFDFWNSNPVQGPDAPGAGAVNVLSVSTRLAQEAAEALEQAGLVCRVLDGGPFTLARAAELTAGQNPDQNRGTQPVAVLDWGHQTAHFAVVRNGQPLFSRVLKDCGFSGVLKGGTDRLGLSPDDCRQLLSVHGLPSSGAEPSQRTELQKLAADLSADTISRLLSELDKTLSYLKSQRSKLFPACLWLAGGGATIRNMESKLSFEIGMPVLPWHLPGRMGSSALGTETSVELLAQAAALSDLGWAS